jgi:hypothetical protein
MAVTETVDRYCEVWNEPDAARRKQLLGAIWGEGASYTDPTTHAPGAAALLEHVGRARERWPGAKVRRSSAVDMHHGVARFAWDVTKPDGAQAAHGIDIVFFSPDSTKILRIIGFFGPLAR